MLHHREAYARRSVTQQTAGTRFFGDTHLLGHLQVGFFVLALKMDGGDQFLAGQLPYMEVVDTVHAFYALYPATGNKSRGHDENGIALDDELKCAATCGLRATPESCPDICCASVA